MAVAVTMTAAVDRRAVPAGVERHQTVPEAVVSPQGESRVRSPGFRVDGRSTKAVGGKVLAAMMSICVPGKVTRPTTVTRATGAANGPVPLAVNQIAGRTCCIVR